MDLILWRHAEAEDGSPDSARKLTARGREQARRIAAWLKPRLPRRCEVLVSPAVRAQQTALALGVPFVTSPAVGTEAAAAAVIAAVDWLRPCFRIRKPTGTSARERCGGCGIPAARPGCSPSSTPSLRDLRATLAAPESEPVVKSSRDDARRTAVGVVARIRNPLEVGGEPGVLCDIEAVIGLEDDFRPIVERPVTEEEPEPPGGKVIAVRGGKAVARVGDSKSVPGSAERRSFHRHPSRERSIDLGESVSLGLAVGPARPAEQAHARGDFLLEIHPEPALDALHRAHRVDIGRPARLSREIQGVL